MKLAALQALCFISGVRVRERRGRLHVKTSWVLDALFPGHLDEVIGRVVLRYGSFVRARRVSGREYWIWTE